MTLDVSIAVAAWGGFWNRYADEFLAAIAAMSPAPREIVIVTDEPVTPREGLIIVAGRSNVPMWDWFNEAVAATTSTWVVCPGIDDLFLPTGLDELDLQGDVISIAGVENRTLWAADQDGYAQIETWPVNPMHGGAIYRRETFLRFPWRRTRWTDWAQWIEFRRAGVDVRFDRKPRFIHRRFDDSTSLNPDAQADDEVAAIKSRLWPEG